MQSLDLAKFIKRMFASRKFMFV